MGSLDSQSLKQFEVDFILICLVLLLFSGCSSPPTRVIAVTGTNIGVEIAQNPATQVPHAKLGYQRAEIALVPTNRREEDPPTGSITGADQTAEVLMELKYAGIFSWGDSGGIYQRLAVGKTAVTRPGAAVMFARNVTGDVDANAAAAVSNASQTVLLGDRSSDFVSDKSQNREENIANMIEALDTVKTQEIVKNLPVKLIPEHENAIYGRFKVLDGDKDGRISQTELNGIGPATSKKYLKMLNHLLKRDNVALDALEAALIAEK